MLKGLSRFIQNRGRQLRQIMGRQTILLEPVCIPRAEHPLSRSEISDSALKVLYRLHKSGYAAYLVGGGVRDRLLGKLPKDFDVATNATPEQVRSLFRNARIIGRRFRIVHVRFGREVIEVTTFRGQAESDQSPHHEQSEAGLLLRDNVWGSIEEDALRRDFTINALYYNIADFAIYDFAGGMADIAARTLRIIGDPETRYREDPVRMLRAIRFAAKLDFTLSTETAAPIYEQAPLLLQIPPARLFDEVLKLFMAGHAVDTLHLLREYRLFGMMFPMTEEAFGHDPHALAVLEQALTNTDHRIREERPVTPAFLYAALLWPALKAIQADLVAEGMPPIPALQQAGNQLMHRQNQHVMIPKRFAFPMREIWDMQLRLEKRHGKRAFQLLHEPRFRAGYDFLLQREKAGEPTEGLAQWWTQFQEASESDRHRMIEALGQPAASGPRRRRRKPRKRKPNADQ